MKFHWFFFLFRYQKRCDELELMCRSYGNQFDTLVKDKDDISSYLKKQFDLRNEQVLDLNDRLLGLQKAKDQQKEFLEKSLRECQDNSRIEIERLENDNFLLSKRKIPVTKKKDGSFFLSTFRNSSLGFGRIQTESSKFRIDNRRIEKFN